MATVSVIPLNHDRITLTVNDTNVSVVMVARESITGYEPKILTVTVFPSSPYDGQKVIFDNGATLVLYEYDLTTTTWVQVGGGSGGGHVIQDNGTNKTQRAKLNFIGFTVADDNVNDATKVTAIAQVNADWNAGAGVAQILNKPTIPGAQVQVDWNQSESGLIDYIKNKPTIPAAQIQSDWNQADSGQLDYIKNKPALNFDPAGSASNAETNAKNYADGLVAGLLDLRPAWDASGNTWPNINGSGTAGAIMKGDAYPVSEPGTLKGQPVVIGDMLISLVDSPGQTDNNWDILDTNIGYVPENVDNKVTSFQVTPDDQHYPTEKLVKDSLDNKEDSLGFSPENSSNKVTSFQVTPDDTHYPSEKLVKDSLDDKVDADDLGDAAYKDTGTTAGTVCAGDDARLSDDRNDSDAFHKSTANEIESLTDIGTDIATDDPLLIEDKSDATPYKKKKLYYGNLLTVILNYLGVFKLYVTSAGDWTTTNSDFGNDATKITGMSVALAAGTRYVVRGSIRCAGPANGIKLAVSHSSLAGIFLGIIRGTAAFTNDSIAAVDTPTAAFYLGTNGQTYFSGTITTTNAETIYFRAAPNTNGQTATVYKEGTYIIIEKLY